MSDSSTGGSVTISGRTGVVSTAGTTDFGDSGSSRNGAFSAKGIVAHLRAAASVPVSFVGLLRGLTAAAVIVSADVHLLLWYHDGFKEVATIGPLFLLNAVGGIVLGVLVMAWRSWIATFLAAGFGFVTLLSFYLSVSVGLFGLHELAGGGPQEHAEVAEWAALVFGMAASWALWRRDTVPAPRDSRG